MMPSFFQILSRSSDDGRFQRQLNSFPQPLDHAATPQPETQLMSLNPLSFPPLPSHDISRESTSSPDHITVSDTASTTSDDDLAEQEWQESLAQLTLLFNLVILPFAGKYFGRKFAYFSI